MPPSACRPVPVYSSLPDVERRQVVEHKMRAITPDHNQIRCEVVTTYEQMLHAYAIRAFGFRNAGGKKPVFFDGHAEPYIELVKELTPPDNAISVSTDPTVMFRIEGFWDAPSEYEAVA